MKLSLNECDILLGFKFSTYYVERNRNKPRTLSATKATWFFSLQQLQRKPQHLKETSKEEEETGVDL